MWYVLLGDSELAPVQRGGFRHGGGAERHFRRTQYKQRPRQVCARDTPSRLPRHQLHLGERSVLGAEAWYLQHLKGFVPES